MDHNMFCFQCEQTAGCSGCTGNMGVCGKSADTAQIQDQLTGALIGLSRSTEGNAHKLSDTTASVVVEGLFATLTNVNFDNEALLRILQCVEEEKKKLVPDCYACAASCGKNNDYDMKEHLECKGRYPFLKITDLIWDQGNCGICLSCSRIRIQR